MLLDQQIEQIAAMCHATKVAWCLLNFDNSQPTWQGAPQWQKDTVIAGVKFHLDNSSAGPNASHRSWMEQKLADGWAYGVEKDPDNKLHPCMVPFDDLPVEQKMKDHLFKSVVHAMKEGFT